MRVSQVVGGLAGGVDFDEVERQYDHADEDIRAALIFKSDWHTVRA